MARQAEAAAEELEPGITRQASLQPGSRNVWTLRLKDGWFARVEIEARAAAIEVDFFDPAGAKGPNVEGEGVFALSRGFLAAGARRVIASHWKVDDDPTAELMGAAFSRIARARKAAERIDYAAALRDAKRDLRGKPAWSAPFYWAPSL